MSFPVKAVVLDWAGTMIDFGCMAPVHALIEVFGDDGIALSAEEARRDMGKAKIDHVRGRGLWIAIKLKGAARPVCEALMEEGILCKETHFNVIRFAPPLTIDREDLEWAADRIEVVLTRP